MSWIGNTPFWIDEYYSLWFSERPWGYLWGEVPKFETHPPFYYSLLKLWHSLFGEGLVSSRFLSVIASSFVMVFVYLTAKLVKKGARDEVLLYALIATLICAVMPFQIYYAQEARPYAFMCLSLSSVFYFVAWIISHEDRLQDGGVGVSSSKLRQLVMHTGLGISLSLVAWFHNIGVIFCVLIGAGVFLLWLTKYKRKKEMFLFLLYSAIISVLLYSPNISNFMGQSKNVSQTFWLSEPSLREIVSIMYYLYGMSLPEYVFYGFSSKFAVVVKMSLFLVSLSVLACLAYRWIRDRQCRAIGFNASALPFIFWMAFAPFLLLLIISFTKQPVLLDRTLIGIQVPVFFLIAALPWCFSGRLKGLVLASLLVYSFSIGAGASVLRYKEALGDERHLGHVAEQIKNDRTNPQDGAVVALPNFSAHILGEELSRIEFGGDVISLTPEYPAYLSADGRVGGTYQHVVDVRPEYAQKVLDALIGNDVIWLYTRREDVYDEHGFVDAWLRAHYTHVDILDGEGKNYSLVRYSRD